MKWCLMFPNVNHSIHLCCQSIINISFPIYSTPHLPSPNAPIKIQICQRSFVNILSNEHNLSQNSHLRSIPKQSKCQMSFCVVTYILHHITQSYHTRPNIKISQMPTHSFANSKYTVHFWKKRALTFYHTSPNNKIINNTNIIKNIFFQKSYKIVKSFGMHEQNLTHINTWIRVSWKKYNQNTFIKSLPTHIFAIDICPMLQ